MQLAPQPWLEDAATRRLLAAFAAQGEALRFVGGCVRDAVMDRPVGDIDCATPATPQRVTALLEDAGLKAVPTGIAYGTVTAVVKGQPFEITTLRRDVACHGRHADVVYTQHWEEDARRRDFTLNALYCDAGGTLYDYTGGVADARAGRIRFIGEATARIREDALRILRFFRFYATHGSGSADPDALDACRACRDMLAGLSGERIQQEMRKLLGAPHPVAALRLLRDSGIMGVLLGMEPAPDLLAPLSQAPLVHDASARHPWLRLALLLRRGGPAQAGKAGEAVASRWKLSNRDRRVLETLLQHPAGNWPEDEPAMLRVARHLSPAQYRLLLLREGIEQGVAPARIAAALHRAEALVMPVFPLKGADVIAAGIPPGPAVGETLARLEAYWEERHYTPGRDELLRQLA